MRGTLSYVNGGATTLRDGPPPPSFVNGFPVFGIGAGPLGAQSLGGALVDVVSWETAPIPNLVSLRPANYSEPIGVVTIVAATKPKRPRAGTPAGLAVVA